jgi:hypothetical protein
MPDLIPKNPEFLLGACSWAQDVATKDFGDYEERENRKLLIHEKYEYYTNPNLTDRISDGESKLVRLLETLNYFDSHGFRRSKHQVDFHKAFVGALLKKIYGNDIYTHLARLMKEYDLKELRPDVIICTPRRFGKTTSVALFVAAVMWALPGIKVDIYSTGRRASKKLLGLIFKLLSILGGDAGNWQKTYNNETLSINSPFGHDASICNSYPSKPQINEQKEDAHATSLIFSFYFNIQG